MYPEAISDYDQAIRWKAGESEFWYNKGAALRLLGETESANLLLMVALKLNPEN